MGKLDSLVWADEFCFSAGGLHIGVRINSGSALCAVRQFLPPCWKTSDSRNVDRIYSVFLGENKKPLRNTRFFNVIYANEARLIRTTDLQEAFIALENDIQAYVAEFAREGVFVHSGVVAWKGKAIIMPGRTYSGKSTLVASLVKAGAAYFSDEYAVLDEWGRVYPYPRRLRLRCDQSSHSIDVQTQMDMKVSERKATPVGLILMTNYKHGVQWAPKLSSPGQAILGLTMHALAARRRPRTVLSTLKALALSAPCFESDRGEAEEVSWRVLDLLETRAHTA